LADNLYAQQHEIVDGTTLSGCMDLKILENTKRGAMHMRYFKMFEDLYDSVITTFKTYQQDASKFLL
jgi:hypothetical protein